MYIVFVNFSLPKELRYQTDKPTYQIFYQVLKWIPTPKHLKMFMAHIGHGQHQNIYKFQTYHSLH